MHEVGEEARRRVRAARLAARTPREFVEDAYRAYFGFIVEDAGRAAFLSRNATTIRAIFEESEGPAGIGELAEDLRAAIAQGDMPQVDVDYCAGAMVAVGLELGRRLVQRDPPDVDGATRFATDLLLAGVFGYGRPSRTRAPNGSIRQGRQDPPGAAPALRRVSLRRARRPRAARGGPRSARSRACRPRRSRAGRPRRGGC